MAAFLFDTAIGRCGFAWTGAGIHRVALPDRDDAAALRHLGAELQEPGDLSESTDPPHWVRAAADGVRALLAGGTDDLRWVDLDLSGVPPFPRAVYAELRTVAPGHTVSYGELAARVGEPGGAQAVGRAMGANPCPIVVPCHRVLAADGAMHGFSAPGGVHTKRRILEIEGALAPALFDL